MARELLGNIKGQKGDTGEQGIPGVKGEKGLKGDQGVKGDPGVKGEAGETPTFELDENGDLYVITTTV